MEILRFDVSSIGATFSRPYTNSAYTTYSHIHKVAITGLLGAIIGINKSHKNTIRKELTEAYKVLNKLKIAIVPKQDSFPKILNTYTETTGFFNAGSTYLIPYEELIRPKWSIYVYDESESKEFEQIKDFILNNKAVFIPYLGKNHFQAKISNMKLLQSQDFEPKSVNKIDSLFAADEVTLSPTDEDRFFIKESYPVGMNEDSIQYIEKSLIFTNDYVEDYKADLIKCDNKILYFI